MRALALSLSLSLSLSPSRSLARSLALTLARPHNASEELPGSQASSAALCPLLLEAKNPPQNNQGLGTGLSAVGRARHWAPAAALLGWGLAEGLVASEACSDVCREAGSLWKPLWSSPSFVSVGGQGRCLSVSLSFSVCLFVYVRFCLLELCR